MNFSKADLKIYRHRLQVKYTHTGRDFNLEYIVLKLRFHIINIHVYNISYF